jgi:hypothetical protein
MAKHAYQTERWAVLREYDSWARKNPDLANKGDPILFFNYLQSERSDLLDFKSRGVDKWQNRAQVAVKLRPRQATIARSRG